MESMIKTNGLTKTFGSYKAVNQVSLSIHKGDIYGFIGKNGAGKTTTMKLLLGTAIPTGGEIRIMGSPDLNAGRRKIGSLIEEPGLYPKCSAYENMKRFSMIYGGDECRINDILALTGLEHTGNKKVAGFSMGMKQRLGIALAMIGNPELLILDEPVNGLDPTGMKEIRDLLQKINTEMGVTIMISSHLLDELSKIATRYGIINDGVLIEEISSEELRQRCRQQVRVVVDNTLKAGNLLEANYPGIKYSVQDRAIVIHSDIPNRAAFNSLLVRGGIGVYELNYVADSFEEYFLRKVGSEK